MRMDAEDLRIERTNQALMEKLWFDKWRAVAAAAQDYAEIGDEEGRGLHDTLAKIHEALRFGLSRTHVYREGTHAFMREIEALWAARGGPPVKQAAASAGVDANGIGGAGRGQAWHDCGPRTACSPCDRVGHPQEAGAGAGVFHGFSAWDV
jgi:hypothetical protein